MYYNYVFDFDEIVSQFFEVMRQNDIRPYGDLQIIADGQIHRFRVEKDSQSTKSGSYKLDITEWPFGFVQDWRESQIAIKFNFKREHLNSEGKTYWNDERYKEAQKRVAEKQKETEEEQSLERERARTHATDFYNHALQPADNSHPYLVKKNIKLPSLDGCDISGIKYNKNDNSLCVPLRNINGDIQSLQWIDAKGEKKFAYHTSPKGAFYSIGLGELNYDTEHKLPILIGEGIATMFTIYEAVGHKYPVIVAAMNCGNLKPVAEELKIKYPDNKIIIMADNDHKRENNPGLTSAKTVYDVLQLAGVVYPEFSKDDTGTDWNDWVNTSEQTKEDISNLILKKISLFNNIKKYFQENC